MEIKKIVEKYLKENNCDGLVQSENCACKLDDLMPCNEPHEDCVSGKARKCDNGCDEINEDGTCSNGWDQCLEEK